MKNVTINDLPIHILDVLEIVQDKGNLVEHEVVIAIGTGHIANQIGISYEVSIHALNDGSSHQRMLLWRANIEELFTAKGATQDPNAKKNLILSALNNTFHSVIDTYRYNTLEQFDRCMMEMTKFFFSIDSMNDEIKYIYQIYKLEEMDMQEFVSATRSITKRCKYMVVEPGQVVPVITEEEMIQLIYNGYPEGWHKMLQKSNLKLVDISIE